MLNSSDESNFKQCTSTGSNANKNNNMQHALICTLRIFDKYALTAKYERIRAECVLYLAKQTQAKQQAVEVTLKHFQLR